jgi:hypothetical protein
MAKRSLLSARTAYIAITTADVTVIVFVHKHLQIIEPHMP